ncbi:Peptide exporter [Forsythia ovata]|uniref:Peptide exporter n=1 Tax=Forsythia ovata TaxID=205694 RepID=A0ABD1RLL0_9LAMI
MKDGRITQDGKYNDILKSSSDFMELVGAHKEALSALDSIEAGAAVVGEDSSTRNAKNFLQKKESPTDQNDKTVNAMGTNGQLIQAVVSIASVLPKKEKKISSVAACLPAIPRSTVLQVSKTATDNPYIPPAPEATIDVPSTSIPSRPLPPSRNARQSMKRKVGAKSGEETSRASTSPPLGKWKYINIGSRQDKLDPTVLGKLPPAVAIAATSVHKYWTSVFGKAADTAEVTKLVKLAEMYTSRSHVLNCEWYKILEMKVDELHSAIGEDEDVEAMQAENKHLRARLVFSEDTMTRAMYNVTKAQTIQKACVDAWKKAESQLKSCQSMIHAKDKELTEALSELAKAKGLLAKLGAPGYA